MRSKFLYVFIAVQIAFLGAIVLSYYAVDWVGSKEIRLKTAPVDPRDIFYGDYVVLNYEISTLPLSLWNGSSDLPGEDVVVYVQLSEGAGGVYEAKGVYSKRPDVGGSDVVLKGKTKYAWEDNLRIDYGLERYYVPEGTGKALEEVRSDMLVVVKVAPWGQQKISKLEY